ncbi:MAG: hypothetical protein JSR60_06295 [Proteobacteria bacterium]|nr:hypothetical protein [Pseudomonadota bacterium]
MNKPVTLSPHARALAEKQARADGFESVDAYVDALIEQDSQDAVVSDWVRAKLEEGLQSPNTGPITKEKIDRLVARGLARVSTKK